MLQLPVGELSARLDEEAKAGAGGTDLRAGLHNIQSIIG